MSTFRGIAAAALLVGQTCVLSAPCIARAEKGAARPRAEPVQVAPSPPNPKVEREPEAALAPQGDAPPEPPAGAPPSPGVVQAQVGELLRQRYEWQTRWSNPTLPLFMLLVGVGALGAGGALFGITEEHDYDCGGSYSCTETREPYRKASIALFSIGVLGVTGSFAAFSFLTTGSRKRTEIDAIDRKLESLGVQASVAPYYSRSAAGASAGLVTSFRF
ncbi:MAG: hypothetical protein ABW352_24000 [Polyangiales bacterium]